MTDPESWSRKMARRKAIQDAKMAAATAEKGLLMVHTGNGKGKPPAARGLILRAVGHGWPVGMVQFVKGGGRRPGELVALERFTDLVDYRVMGQGFTWETQDRARDIAAAQAAWTTAQAMMAEPRYRLVFLGRVRCDCDSHRPPPRPACGYHRSSRAPRTARRR